MFSSNESDFLLAIKFFLERTGFSEKVTLALIQRLITTLAKVLLIDVFYGNVSV